MLPAMARHAPSDTSLRDKVYESLREALTAGRFQPGQKLTFRFIAGTLGVSLTPVREAIRRGISVVRPRSYNNCMRAVAA